MHAAGDGAMRARTVSNEVRGLESTMDNTKRFPLVTLGWQSWSIVVIVLVIMLTAAAYLLLG
jgi:hypothetical protein